MPYRPPSKKRQDDQARRQEAMRRGKDRARMAREPTGRMPDLPDLRRICTGTVGVKALYKKAVI